MTDTPDDGFAGDTTIRRPRIPAPPDPVALAATDHASDTVIVRRGARRRDHSAPTPTPSVLDETTAGTVAAYPSRVAAPVRGSRKGQPSAVTDRGVGVADRGWGDEVPDATGIRRAVRARARRRLAAVVVAIVALVAVLLAALTALVFAVGV